VNLIGLACGFLGAVVLAFSLVMRKERAVGLGVSRLSGDTIEKNVSLHAVAERVQQSNRAVAGLSLIALGFVLQAVAAWP
jgi:hypothetical protein